MGQVAADTVIGTGHVGLAGQISGKQEARSDLVLVQVGQQIQARDRAVVFERDRKAKPGWIGMLGGFGQVQKFFAGLKARFEKSKIVFARLDELRRFVQLRQATGGLHVGDFEVVAQVAVGVLVVIAFRQIAQLLAKALAAGVVLARLAVAVAAPVTKALGNRLEFLVVGKHGAAFPHGDVVGRVKAQGGNVSKGAHHLAAVGGAQRVAAVFHQP